MTSSAEPSRHQQPDEDRAEAEALIDEEAAEIDPRSPDAPDQIAELIGDADELGLPTPLPSQVDPPDPDEM